MAEQAEAELKIRENDGQDGLPKSAAEQRLEAEIRVAEEKAAKDKAALERVRRKLTRLMLVSLTVTFIALAVVAAAIIYKIAHTRSAAKALPQNADTAPAAQAAPNPLSGLLIQTAPNSGAEAAFAREAQEAAEKQAKITGNDVTEQKIPLAAGEKLEEAGLYGNLLLLRISARGSKGPQFIIYDFARRQIIARIKPANPE